MDSLIAQLNSSFIPALRLSLSGHEPAEEMANSATVDRWRCDIDQGLKQLRNRYPKSAIVGIGFSLGGTLLADAIVRTNPSPLTGLVLLAPAIKFTWRGTAIRMLSVLRAFGVALKSKSLAAYRAHDETPLSAYHALFALASGLTRQSSAEPLVTIPALVLVSPKDELISMTGLSLWIEENELARWKLESITPRASIEGSYQHLIVDEPSLGSEEWHRVKDILDLFLKSIAEQQCANQLLRETRIPAAANLQ
jgi:esterase/lipase